MAHNSPRTREELGKLTYATVYALLKDIGESPLSTIDNGILRGLYTRLQILKRSDTEGVALLALSAPWFLRYARQIVSRDESFFLDADLEAELAKNNVKKDKEIEDLTHLMRTYYRSCSADKRNEIQNYAIDLVMYSAEYAKLTNARG